MKILSFDTSNNITSVAISDNQNIVYYEEDLTPSTQSERLISIIEDGLQRTRLQYNDIDYLGVISGPGSFTGIRIGLAAARAILLSTQVKAVAVTNFETYYYRAIMQVDQYDKIFVILNAYRNQLYLQSFDKNGKISNPILVEHEAALDIIKAAVGNIICAGNAINFIYNKLSHLQSIVFLPRFLRIKALYINKYICEYSLWKRVGKIEPLYIRLPDAKLKNQ